MASLRKIPSRPCVRGGKRSIRSSQKKAEGCRWPPDAEPRKVGSFPESDLRFVQHGELQDSAGRNPIGKSADPNWCIEMRYRPNFVDQTPGLRTLADVWFGGIIILTSRRIQNPEVLAHGQLARPSL